MRRTLYFLLFAFSTLLAQAQLDGNSGTKQIVPIQYQFYNGDTLDGFDFNKAMLEANAIAIRENYDEIDKRFLIKKAELRFVVKKYKIPLPEKEKKKIQSYLTTTCNNLNFDTGDTTGWTGGVGYNTYSLAPLTVGQVGIKNHYAGTTGLDQNPQTSCSYFSFEDAASGTDRFGLFPRLDNLQTPNSFSFRLGGEKSNQSGNCDPLPFTEKSDTAGGSAYAPGEFIEQTFPVTAANCLFRYDYAVVLENPAGHTAGESPYFKVEVLDAKGDSIKCLQYYKNSNSASEFKTSATKVSGTSILYLSWQANSVNLQPYIGQNITIRFSSAGCTLGGHFGYAYVDGACGALQLLSAKPANCTDTMVTIIAPPGGTYSWSQVVGLNGVLGTGGIVGTKTADSVTVHSTGRYQVVVTSSGGCSYTLDTTITISHGALPVTTTPYKVDSCKGNTTGSVLAVASSGTAPFTYSWAGTGAAGQTGATATNIGVGTYTVTVTSSAGCTGTATATVGGFTKVRLTGSSTNDVCFGGSTGTATVVATGGRPNYTYSWAGSNAVGATGATASGLKAGTYTVTVQDALGCSLTNAYTITAPAAIVPTVTPTNSTCGNANGKASVTATTGGGGTYTYAWAGTGAAGQTGITATGLTAGNTYTVSVTDQNGCVGTATTTPANTAGPSLTSLTSVQPSCHGGTNGSATATLSGGTAAYTFSWSNGATAITSATSATATGLSAVTYSVTVTDANACPATSAVTLSQPTLLAVSTPTVTATTCGQNVGTAAVTGSGGTAPYTFAWAGNGASGQTAATATALGVGSYTVTITDAKGCNTNTVANIAVLSGPAPVATTVSNVKCFGQSNGSTSVSATGGSTPYTYAWSNGGTNALNTGLVAGSYTVTVTDAGGCSAQSVATVTQPQSLTLLSQTSVQDVCFGENVGSASLNVSGGTPNYTYSWAGSNAVGATGATASGLKAGTYTVTVQDALGCSLTNAYTITAPAAIVPTVTPTNSTCGNANGKASVTATTGGGGTYTYAWAGTGAAGQTGITATGLTAGNTYTVSVTDQNGCVGTATTTPANTAGPSLTSLTSVQPSCHGGTNGSATATLSGGTAAYTFSWSNGATAITSATSATATGLSAVTYSVTVTDANACPATSAVTLSQPTLLAVSTPTVTATTCGQNVGTAAVTGSGGTAPYTFAWAGNGASGQTAATATALGVGSYTVTITDAKGCNTNTVANIAVLSGPAPVATTVSNVKCFGQSNGSTSVSATGGSTPYTYAWSNGGTNALDTGLVAGSYTITVTDAGGCSAQSVATVTQLTKLAVSGQGYNTTCFGGSDGYAVATPSGGTPNNYNFKWSNGSTIAAINGVVAGTYTITVTDGNGCVKDTSFVVGQPSVIAITTSSTSANCGQKDGSAAAQATGGTVGGSGYTYSWSSGATGQTATAIGTGTYTVTVTDSKGCHQNTTATVNNLNGVVATMGTPNQNTCAGSCTASVTVAATGGTTPYTYKWSNGATSATANGLCAQPLAYTVTVTDNTGCSSTQTATITEPPALVLPAIAQRKLCIGQQTYLVPKASGGTPQYTYTWAPGNTIADSLLVVVTGTNPTSYTVSVTDANNCPNKSTAIAVPNYPALSVSVATPSVSVCPNAPVSFTATGTGGDDTLTYTWSTTPVAHSTTVSFNATSAQVYTVTVNDACTTPSSSATAMVTINPVPLVHFMADSTKGCPLFCTKFVDQGSIASGSITKWTWLFGDGDSSNLQTPRHCFPTPGTYSIKLKETSNLGCSADSSINNYITAFAKPTAAFTYNPSQVTTLTPLVYFINESQGATAYQWSIADTSAKKPPFTTNVENPTFSYAGATGVFCDTLWVTNAAGCRDSTTQCINVGPDFVFYVPDAFSPNGDLVNDLFFPKGAGYNVPTFRMSIYDRWGHLMYWTDDITKGWDGTKGGNNGEPCPQDVYTYLITVKDAYANNHSYTGHVTLIR